VVYYPTAGIREKHKVITERAAATGIVICQVWFKDGRQDRADGPALIYCDPATHNVTYEAWFRQGQLSRIDGPALIRRDPATGTSPERRGGRTGAKFKPAIPQQQDTTKVASITPEGGQQQK
jgi:hypothetical protein